MDVKKLQRNLNSVSSAGLIVDGDLGPKTFAALLNYAVGRNLGNVSVALGRELYSNLRKYQINTPLRIIHFLAQAAHETAGFRYFSELGSGKDLNKDGFDDYLQRYDFRKDLGNNAVGMGPKYRGRGIFQLTGFFNYTLYSAKLGIDLVKNPQRAADPDVSTVIACMYWNDKKLSVLADRDDVVAITKKINGGQNGLKDRQNYVSRLKKIFGI